MTATQRKRFVADVADSALRAHVRRRIYQIRPVEGRGVPATATAALARLRNGVSRPLGDDLELVGLTTAGLFDDGAELSDEPMASELAAYAALTLYGVHQQSVPISMHAEDVSFGRAVGRLSAASGRESAVWTRFAALATASFWDERLHHARGLIQQLRAARLPLDYGRLAVDLRALQDNQRANWVRNAWGRDYHRPPPTDITADSTENNNIDNPSTPEEPT